MTRIRIRNPGARWFNSGVSFVLAIAWTGDSITLEPIPGTSDRLCARAPTGCCGHVSWLPWIVEVLDGGRMYIPEEIYDDLDAWLLAQPRRGQE
jgi:hypothetical protein